MRGATFSVRLKKFYCSQICCCTILAENDIEGTESFDNKALHTPCTNSCLVPTYRTFFRVCFQDEVTLHVRCAVIDHRENITEYNPAMDVEDFLKEAYDENWRINAGNEACVL